MRKGKQWHFGMKAHIGVDADTKLVHSAAATAANVNDAKALPGALWGDQAYQGQQAVLAEHAPKAEDRSAGTGGRSSGSGPR